MKSAVIILSIAMLLPYGEANACSIQETKKVQIGANEGIEGVCSNNALPISCEYKGDNEITCDGPGGGYTGYDLDNLIFSACGCSSQTEKGKQLKEELKEGKSSGTGTSY